MAENEASVGEAEVTLELDDTGTIRVEVAGETRWKTTMPPGDLVQLALATLNEHLLRAVGGRTTVDDSDFAVSRRD